MTQIVMVDDDAEICELLVDFLCQHGYQVTAFSSAKALLAKLDELAPALFILDIMLPDMSGLELCRKLRDQLSTPIIMLTALGEETDRVVGLEIGADDYLTKPFAARELLARIRAVLRRAKSSVNVTAMPHSEIFYEFDGWVLEKNRRRLFSPEQVEVALTSSEFNFLLLLIERPQRVLSRDVLLDHFKGHDATPFDRSIDVQMSRLRQKIEKNPKLPTLLKTIRNEGYMLTAAVKLRT